MWWDEKGRLILAGCEQERMNLSVSVPQVYRRWEIRQQHLHVLLPADVTANSMERQIFLKLRYLFMLPMESKTGVER